MFCNIFLPIPMLLFIAYTLQQDNDSAAMLKTYDAASDSCAKDNGFDKDYVHSIWGGKQFSNDTKLQCFFSCVCLKVGMMDETGDVKEDMLEKVTAAFYNITLADKIGDVCDIAKQGDLCQTAYDVMQCILNIQNGQQS